MSKVMQTYASRKGVDATTLRFLVDGDRVKPDDTPDSLDLDDQDQIDCMLEQSGGCLQQETKVYYCNGRKQCNNCGYNINDVSLGVCMLDYSSKQQCHQKG